MNRCYYTFKRMHVRPIPFTRVQWKRELKRGEKTNASVESRTLQNLVLKYTVTHPLEQLRKFRRRRGG